MMQRFLVFCFSILYLSHPLPVGSEGYRLSDCWKKNMSRCASVTFIGAVIGGMVVQKRTHTHIVNLKKGDLPTFSKVPMALQVLGPSSDAPFSAQLTVRKPDDSVYFSCLIDQSGEIIDIPPLGGRGNSSLEGIYTVQIEIISQSEPFNDSGGIVINGSERILHSTLRGTVPYRQTLHFSYPV